LKLNAPKALSVVAEKIAQPLGMKVEEAAWGAHLIAGSNMIRAIKAVSSERGRDPREYALVAFGGNGPLFAATMVAALMIRRVVIPPSAGVFSSYGLLYSEVAYHLTRTRKARLGAIDPAEIDAILGELEGEARARLAEDGFVEDRIALERGAALHYQGQSFELEVPVPAGMIDGAALAAIEEAYSAEHEKTYGHRAGADEPVELVTLKVVGRGVPDVPRAALAAMAGLPEGVVISEPSRQAYFGPVHGWRETRVVNRADLAEPRRGPCIVEEYDSTCVVPPGSLASLDRFGNIVIDVPVTAPL
jgi:N-methylhydantoinase A